MGLWCRPQKKMHWKTSCFLRFYRAFDPRIFVSFFCANWYSVNMNSAWFNNSIFLTDYQLAPNKDVIVNHQLYILLSMECNVVCDLLTLLQFLDIGLWHSLIEETVSPTGEISSGFCGCWPATLRLSFPSKNEEQIFKRNSLILVHWYQK